MMIQLTTMSGIKIPRDAFNSSGKYAFMTNSTIVTKAAIMTIKHGIRISRGIYDLTIEMIKLEQMSTNVAAPPIAMPFFTEVVTARLGHIPSTSTNMGLYSKIPLVNSLSLPCSAMLLFFQSRRRHTRLVSDWSSDVCSSDLDALFIQAEDGIRDWSVTGVQTCALD